VNYSNIAARHLTVEIPLCYVVYTKKVARHKSTATVLLIHIFCTKIPVWIHHSNVRLTAGRLWQI